MDGDWVAVARYPEEHFVEKVRGEDLVGLRYEGPFDHLPAQDGVEHRVIPWDEVSLAEGTGIVHIAPGAGGEDFDLSREFDLPVLMPIDESGRMLPGYGDFEGLSTGEVQDPVIESLRERGLLVRAGSIEHRYPVCWRCSTPLVFRVVDDWFISAQEIRQPMLDGNATVEWTPPQYKKRMDDWLRNMGDWNISRRRYFGLPLPFYECECGHFNVIGSRGSWRRAPCGGSTSCRSCTGPGSTTWSSAARSVAARWSASPRSVTRGSTPESSTSPRSAGRTEWDARGRRHRLGPRPDRRSAAGPRVLGAVVSADWVTEMREQIRLWFYSQCFMAITLDGRQPYRRVLTYEKVYDENGREMHKSWGNAIELNEALERMGADVMRWLYCDQTPSQPLRFGFGMAEEVKKELLTFWNSVSFFVTTRTSPASSRASRVGTRSRSTAGSPRAPRSSSATRPTLRALLDAGRDRGVRGLLRRFVQLVHPPVAPSLLGRRPGGAASALACAHQALRVIAPVMPFLAENLWRNLVSPDRVGVPRRLAGTAPPTRPCWPRWGSCARSSTLGRQARDASGSSTGSRCAGSSSRALRRPLRTRTRSRRAAREGGRVRRGGGNRAAREAESSAAGAEAREGARRRPRRARGGGVRGARRRAVPCGGHELGPEEVLVERRGREGWSVAAEDGLTVALDTALDRSSSSRAACTTSSTSNTMRKDSRGSSSPTASC